MSQMNSQNLSQMMFRFVAELLEMSCWLVSIPMAS